MLSKHIGYSISITFISWIVGMIVNALLRHSRNYDRYLGNLNFMESEIANKVMGVGLIKWIIKNTPLRFLNQKLKLSAKTDMAGLYELRREMTKSEIDHLIGFLFVSAFALFELLRSNHALALTLMVVNTLMNLYPSLLQQANKRRIDRLTGRLSRSRPADSQPR